MLKTEFLGLNYHPNPATNTDEVDAEKYFNENYFTIDANAKKNYEDLTKLKEDLEQENNELSNNMPWNTVAGKSLHITDSAKYSKNKLSISGDMEQEKRSGKNKFKIPESATSNGVTLTNNGDGSFTLNGTTTGIAIFNATLNNSLKAGTYTLSYKSSVALGNSFFLRVRDENMTLVNSAKPVSQVQGNGTSSVASYTTSVEAAIVAINLTQTGVTYNNVVIYAQLEEGTTATEFEQYGAMPSTEFPSMPLTVTGVQKIKQFEKNFIPYPYTNSTMTARGINYVSNSDGSISISGTSNSNVADFYLFGNSTDNGNYLHLKQDTYFLKDTGNTNIIYIAREKTLGVLVGINTILQALKTQDCYFYGFFVRVNNGATVNTVIYPQLALGNTDSDYEPYCEQIHTLNLGTTQLCAIKDTNKNIVAKDRAVYRNGKWQWEKIIKKKVLNETENWYVTGTDTSGVNRFGTNTVFADAQPATSVNVIQPCVCDKLKTVTAGNTYNKVEGISISILHSTAKTTAVYIYTEETKNMTIAEFKTWLGANNLTVYYVLATPEYIDCTAEQSAVLDKLYNNFELQKDTNNIIVETDNGVGVNLELEYMQDLQTKLNLLEAMCVSNASQEVE
ncbi:MAG: hypothetical protein J6D03_09025 [Clostridia bacterium]|nr:hypothetical protein [Clostridia bacterium]